MTRAILAVPFLLAACAHLTPAEHPSIPASDARNIATLEQGIATALPGRLEEEWQLVTALENAGLLHLAYLYAVPLARAPGHPHHLEAYESLVRLQEPRHDDFLVPASLNALPPPAGLSAPALVQLSFLRAQIAFRKGQLEEVLALTAQVPEGNAFFPRAQYLTAITLADPRLAGGARLEEALDVLTRLVPKLGPSRDANVRSMALLGLGRISYGLRRWAEAVRWYEAAAQLAPTRTEALFERSFASLQQGDWAHALAALSSPEVIAAGIAEAPVAEAMVLHFSGDDLGAEKVLASVKPSASAQACEPRQNPRLAKADEVIASWQRELAVVENTAGWSGTATGTTFADFLRRNLDTLGKLREHLCSKASQFAQNNRAMFASSADLLGIEVALGHRDLDLAIARAERVLAQFPREGAPTSELLFRLAALRQARAEVLSGADAEEERAQVSRLIGRILEGDQTWERLEEARHFLDAR